MQFKLREHCEVDLFETIVDLEILCDLYFTNFYFRIISDMGESSNFLKS